MSRSIFKFCWDQLDFWLSAEFYSIGFSAFFGVAIRDALTNYFSQSYNCASPSGCFMLEFFTETYLVPNFLGCFIMAYCIHNTKTITGVSTPLFKALTTGLCGCITTFSSWMNGAVDRLFNQYDFYTILVMIWMELWLIWCAFTLGFAASKLVNDVCVQVLTWWYSSKEGNEADDFGVPSTPNPIATQPTPTAAPNAEQEAERSGSITSKRSDTSKSSRKTRFVDNNEEPIVEAKDSRISGIRRGTSRGTLTSSGKSSKRGPLNAISARVSLWREDPDLDEEEDEEEDGDQSPFVKPSMGRRTTGGSSQGGDIERQNTEQGRGTLRSSRKTITRVGRILTTPNSSPRATVASVTSGPIPQDTEFGAPSEQAKEEEKLTMFELVLKYEYYIWMALFWTSAIIIWAILIAQYNIPEFQNDFKRDYYRAIALAPLGAWARWAPTRFPWIKGFWPEMNPQTMLANTVAVTFECFLLVLVPTYTWTSAINDGFNGSCSTVSTFFAELHSLYLEKGPMVSFRYGLVTFGLAIAIIQIIRGGDQPYHG